MEVSFRIPCAPVAKARPRVTKSGHAYTPGKTKNYEELVKWSYIKACGHTKLERPLSVEICFYMPIPKKTSKTQKEKMLAGKIRPAKRPDIDNLAKAVLDALNGLAYNDDNQIVELILQKKYGENSCTEVFISEMFGVN